MACVNSVNATDTRSTAMTGNVCVCLSVRVCVCGHVYVVYEDTNLYNDIMGMT